MNIVSVFQKRYEGLNKAQKKAVDTIDGPVMVIAGPGTGKTELLSMRAANILRKTDASAENILCLTFTESGASAMRERLVGLIGKDAYHIAVHTFHSFGSEVITKYNDYFYNGATFRPSDELTTYEILYNIFSKLPHDNPLSSKLNGDFSYLKKVQNTISDFKRSGLTPDEIQRILRDNQNFLEYAEPYIQAFFDRAIHKNMIAELSDLLRKISKYTPTSNETPNIVPSLSEVFYKSLAGVIEVSDTTQKTAAITAWRNSWCEKNREGKFVFKDTNRAKKLVASSLIYNEYLNAMQNAQVYDYDDMILRLVHALEIFPELKFNLQEQYQYIMVDEFQDTNGAQMRILLSLTDNPSQNGKPNILIVGDDDQAIYSFQGAEVSNILLFQKQFTNPEVITLTENYRSTSEILDHARSVITLGTERLEGILDGVDKTPHANIQHKVGETTLTEFPTIADEYSSTAEIIKKLISEGKDPNSIAVLARNHRDIKRFIPYLAHREIPMSYEHQENILEQPPIKILIAMAQAIEWINNGAIDKLDALLPELLAHPAWGVSPETIWHISLESYKKRQAWLETMREIGEKTRLIANFLIEMAYLAVNQPIEITLDQLFGSQALKLNEDVQYIAPFKDYFFGKSILESSAFEYATQLNALSRLRELIREYRPNNDITLKIFIEFIEVSKKANINLTLNATANPEQQAVQIMTAHKSKGLEFDSVFIINSVDQVWGSKSRGYVNRLGYPANMQIAPPGDTEDERLRLFFVAMTRAKRHLYVSYAKEDFAGKTCFKASFLETNTWDTRIIDPSKTPENQLEAAKSTWQETLITPKTNLREVLLPYLRHYQLSATHLNNFIDVTSGGPQAFLLQNLLHFPVSPLPNAALGSAMHATLKLAHEHVSHTGERKPIEDILYEFEKQLKRQRLGKNDFTYQLQKGSEALQAYLEKKYQSFTPQQITERNFHTQGAVLGEAHLTGIVDVMEVDKEQRTISVIDYKTGKPTHTWKGSSDFEKIKLHKYRQQLMFYKLLVEHSRDYKNFTVNEACLEFIEPDIEGAFASLSLNFDNNELQRFQKLTETVWRHIKAADFIDTSLYEQNYKGILAFEEDLLKS